MKEKIYNKSIFILEMLISLVLGVSIYKILYKYQDLQYISKLYLAIAIVSVISLLVIIVLNTIKYKKTVEKLFLTYIIPIGIIFMVLLPIDFVPDEDSHIYKAYDLSKGNIITPFGENKEGDIYVPKELVDLHDITTKQEYKLLHEYFQKETNYEELVPVQTIAKTYFPASYVTGAVVFAVGRLFNANILLLCYIIRLINFILTIFVGYYCIKLIPFGKLVLAIYMFLPMYIQQSAAISADVFLNSMALLFIVYNLKLLYQEHDLNLKQKIIYYLLAGVISVSKYVYFPLTFMSLLLINNKNISKKNKKELIIVSIVSSIILAGLWFLFSQQYVDSRETIKLREVEPVEQIKYILQEPVSYINVLKHTFINYGGYYIYTFLGSELGLLNIYIPQIYIIIYLISLVVLPLLETSEKSFSKYQKLLTIFIVIILVVLVMTGLYITWTKPKATIIEGVQGRYFIPVFILVLLTAIDKNRKTDIKYLEIKYFLLYFVLSIVILIEIHKHFMI